MASEIVQLNKRPRLYPSMKAMSELPEPPVKPEPAVSGRYEAKNGNVEVELRVDVDKDVDQDKFRKVLMKVSGTISNTKKNLWDLGANSVYFQQLGKTVTVESSAKKRVISTGLKCCDVNGQRMPGKMVATFMLEMGWWVELKIEVKTNSIEFQKGQRKSKFFRDVKLDIDYSREKPVWPVFELFQLAGKPAGMEDRKLDAFSAFEDAGIKLEYSEGDSQKVDDPTPGNAWSKADLYNVMQNYFDSNAKKSNIWCMQGESPPDRRFMGFSFDKSGSRGFALFLGHRSFSGIFDEDVKVRARATRRLLHYLVHECGHCLGLKHPFEIGQPHSLSWMNYAWRYDQQRGGGSFYESFEYSFSDDELYILRHSPAKVFMDEATADVMTAALGEKFNPKSDIPDETGTDENDDEDMDTADTDAIDKLDKIPDRKIDLKLKFRTTALVVGELLATEARVKNVGKIPVVIEEDLKPEGGNISVSITTPSGKVKTMEPYVKPIKSGYDSPVVLYSSSAKEGTDRISDLITIGDTSEGYAFKEPGKYVVKAKYSAGKYSATTETYTIEVKESSSTSAAYSKETGYKVAEAASLGGSSYKGFEKVKSYYDTVVKEPVEKMKNHVATIVSLFEGLLSQNNREQGSKTRPKAFVTPSKALNDTKAIVDNYKTKGTKEDNLFYGKLVLKRTSMYLMENKESEADAEFNQMVADLIKRDVKYDTIKSISNEYEKIKKPEPITPTYSAGYLQKRLEDVVTWVPKYETYGNARDYSGVGLTTPFNEFDPKEIAKAKKITSQLENKYEETKDLGAVLEYADVLQKGREVNYQTLQYAVRAYSVHSDEAHHAGMKYPEPKKRNLDILSQAAMIGIMRKGTPEEGWMNYWRCDAHFNYHHQHWHSVYNAGGGLRKHLERQGELFGYMHSQMLARYDAERESWGLPPVKPWQLNEIAQAFNAGLEFHEGNPRVRPRRSAGMPQQYIQLFEGWIASYHRALSTASANMWQIPNANQTIELNSDWAGHTLESTTSGYESAMDVGSLHNYGHGIFGSMTTEPGYSGYMSSTVTAVRDPIFFRWHKMIDTLLQASNDKWYSDLSSDGPPVLIEKNDIVITHKSTTPGDFDKFSGDDWKVKHKIDSVLNTKLLEPTMAYEWDDKLDHDKFFYHIRFKRSPSTPASKPLILTVRIFICPDKVSQSRYKWIEMDKFVTRMEANQKFVVLTRADILSSVIKRDSSIVNESSDNDKSATMRGFCECGWPYNMLLPRGKRNGEGYKLCVFISDNKVDTVNVRTACGSMSYCGAQNQEYPDVRPMGYPFSTKAVINGREVTDIVQDFPQLPNAAINDFTIKNKVRPETTSEEGEKLQLGPVLWPDEKEDDTPLDTSGAFRPTPPSSIGIVRVLIYDDDISGETPGQYPIRIRFKGRGTGNGSYTVSNATFALRQSNLNITGKVSLTVDGNSEFSVPEGGVWTDAVDFNFAAAFGDYAVTFRTVTPGCALMVDFGRVNTYIIRGGQQDVEDDWQALQTRGVAVSSSRFVYCIEKIQKA